MLLKTALLALASVSPSVWAYPSPLEHGLNAANGIEAISAPHAEVKRATANVRIFYKPGAANNVVVKAFCAVQMTQQLYDSFNTALGSVGQQVADAGATAFRNVIANSGNPGLTAAPIDIATAWSESLNNAQPGSIGLYFSAQNDFFTDSTNIKAIVTAFYAFITQEQGLLVSQEYADNLATIGPAPGGSKKRDALQKRETCPGVDVLASCTGTTDDFGDTYGGITSC